MRKEFEIEMEEVKTEQEEDVITLYEKSYNGYRDLVVLAEYYKRKHSAKRKIVMPSMLNSLKESEIMGYEPYIGCYCLQCGEFHEYPQRTADRMNRSGESLCKCKKPLRDRPRITTNIRSLDRDGPHGMREAVPHRVRITEKGDKIRIAATARNWFIEPVSATLYSRYFTITVIINTKTGMSFMLPAVSDGKVLFYTRPGVYNITLSSTNCGHGEANYVDSAFMKDIDVKTALLEILEERIPGLTCNKTIESLMDMINANYLRDLYPFFSDNDLYDVRSQAWRMLRKRFCKDEKTFPQYLYWGCSEVATKSIRRILYTDPEQKWMLRFLYKTLGITNIDFLRKTMEIKDKYIFSFALGTEFRGRFESKEAFQDKLLALNVVKNSGKTDMEKFDYVFKNRGYHLAKTIGEYIRKNDLPESLVLKFKTLDDCYKTISSFMSHVQSGKKKHRYSWSKMTKPYKYGKDICRLTESDGQTKFRIIDTPIDVFGVTGQHYYRIDADAVIKGDVVMIEMTHHKKHVCLIAVDKAAKKCLDVKKPRFGKLSGFYENELTQWAKKHSLHLAKPIEDVITF